ncbi:hypothetical protein [Cupriavidus sp. H18C1]|uniref:hypothetical protein n=1 Tax=Cupriavidus sp. H18C1 TaxID=3241601 RepID=UPI003BB98C5E
MRQASTSPLKISCRTLASRASPSIGVPSTSGAVSARRWRPTSGVSIAATSGKAISHSITICRLRQRVREGEGKAADPAAPSIVCATCGYCAP